LRLKRKKLERALSLPRHGDRLLAAFRTDIKNRSLKKENPISKQYREKINYFFFLTSFSTLLRDVQAEREGKIFEFAEHIVGSKTSYLPHK
jgi:hypothetical protein